MNKNIVLTGFMGTGKSTVGKIISQKTGFEFIDTDALIVAKDGRTISEIFAQDGEQFFRKLEYNVVCEVARKTGAVISCGGGVVLNSANIDELRKNGVIVNLSATVEEIVKRTQRSSSRPLLSKSPQQIFDLMKQREEFYKNCDISIKTDGLTVQQVATKILSDIIFK